MSPDGASLLYVAGGPDGEALVVMDMASRATRVVAQLPGDSLSHISRAAVSPDGARSIQDRRVHR